MEAKVQAAKRVLNLLGVAIKASALYFPSHPETARATETFFTAIVAYMRVHGPLSVHVGKETLSVDGVVVDVSANANLAYSLYGRKLSDFTILPTVTQPTLARFIAVIGMERGELEAAGGVGSLLQASGLGGVEVTELALPAGADVVVLGLDAFYGLLGRSRMNPEEREKIVEVLQTGPDEAAKLLQNVWTLARDILEESNEDGQVRRVQEAIRSLDRIILNEPFDQQKPLYTNLAEALLRLEKPLGPRLARVLLGGAAEEVAIQVMLDHLSSEQFAKVVLMSSEGQDATEQVTSVMREWPFDGKKAREVLSVLESLMPRTGRGSGSLGTEVGWSEVPKPRATAEKAARRSVVKLSESQMAISDTEIERYLEEAQRIDEAGSIRDTIKTLVDVLGNEVEEKDLTDVAEALYGYLPWLLDHREFAFLRVVIEDLKTSLHTASGPQARAINGLLERAVTGPVLAGLIAALWEGRESPVELEVQACLDVLADQLVDPLVRALGTEPRPGMRAMLCDVLVRIGRDRVDELGSFVDDFRWYVVRNIASILGRLRAPQAVPYLARLVEHSDARVRAQTVDALASIGTEEAQTLLATFVRDPSRAVRLRALKSLDARGMASAFPSLLAILAVRDPFNRLFAIRQPAVEAVARLGAREALPLLQRLARARLALGWRGRELRQNAQMAVAAIEGTPINEQR